ncbi:Uncharacterised protein [Chlamydia trachomatis]|nr:Uncharacterised protein [Chlamydia trachomatis]
MRIAYPIRAIHHTKGELGSRFTIFIDCITHMRFARLTGRTFVIERFATRKRTQTCILILRRSFDKFQNLRSGKRLSFGWVIAIDKCCVFIVTPREALIAVATIELILYQFNLIISTNIGKTREFIFGYI